MCTCDKVCDVDAVNGLGIVTVHNGLLWSPPAQLYSLTENLHGDQEYFMSNDCFLRSAKRRRCPVCRLLAAMVEDQTSALLSLPDDLLLRVLAHLGHNLVFQDGYLCPVVTVSQVRPPLCCSWNHVA